MAAHPFEILLTCAPGLEAALRQEAEDLGLVVTGTINGGVTVQGTWPDVWRANYILRGANAVLARIGQFRASHLSELDKRARAFGWKAILPRGSAVTVSASCKASRIYHSGAARQRIETALVEEAGAVLAPDGIEVLARIEKDICTLSLNTSGELLHKRGAKEAVGKAPLRETMAALFLRQCGYRGTEPVLDPMCGSGTFVIEAAEIALGLAPGRARPFAFEQLKSFDAKAFAALKPEAGKANAPPPFQSLGFDRDAGAVAAAGANAGRAGVETAAAFKVQAISVLRRPNGPPGLVICNPPYGGRVGDRKKLGNLYASFGQVLATQFRGWRVGLVTNDEGLAKATALPFAAPSAPVLHGGLRVRLWQTGPLP